MFNLAVQQMDLAACVCCNVVLVRDYYDCLAAVVEAFQDLHDLGAGAAVQITGRLVCQQDVQLDDEHTDECYFPTRRSCDLGGMLISASSPT